MKNLPGKKKKNQSRNEYFLRHERRKKSLTAWRGRGVHFMHVDETLGFKCVSWKMKSKDFLFVFQGNWVIDFKLWHQINTRSFCFSSIFCSSLLNIFHSNASIILEKLCICLIYLISAEIPSRSMRVMCDNIIIAIYEFLLFIYFSSYWFCFISSSFFASPI